MKTCTKCGGTKQLTEFNKHSAYKGGYRNICKTCYNKYQLERYYATRGRERNKNLGRNSRYDGDVMVYKRDEFIFLGTVTEVAEKFNMSERYVRWKLTPTGRERSGNGLLFTKLEEDEDADD